MENLLDDFQKPRIPSDKELFLKLWTKPREVFTYIHEQHYDKYVNLLLALAGIVRAFDSAETRSMGAEHSLGYIIGTSIIGGALLGWIWYYLYAALVSWTGRWLNGFADARSILRVFAYAMIPSILALVLLIPQILVVGNELFISESELESENLFDNLVFFGTALWEFVLVIYTLVLSVVGISVVQKMSIGKAILNLLLPILVIGVPILLIVLVMQGF